MKATISNILGVTVFLATIITLQAAPSSAQITINIPKLPKIKKEKPKVNVQTEGEGVGPRAVSPPAGSPAAPSANCERGVTRVHLEDLEKTRKEAEGFRPGLRGFYVSALNDGKNIYLEAALLPSVRKQFIGERDSEFAICMNPALDKLATLARTTLPSYAGPTNYTFGTSAEKKVLLGTVSDLAQAKVIKVGIRQPNWLIEKDSFNFPTARYKHGMVTLQYQNDEFCWVYWINLVQTYAGGGTYGASYGNYVARSLAGCPAAK